MRRRTLIASGLMAGLAAPARAAAPVVLELFTSQGCSSCPPADAFLGELAAQPGVIALAWHVDYWNNLGWRDPYASRAWTDRQRTYARQLRDEVYTPALVINGAAMVVGSDRAAVRSAMQAASGLPIAVALTRTQDGLRAETPQPGLLVTYDPESATAVGAGENGGRRLREYRIVRAVQMLEAGTARLPPVTPGQGVVLLVQGADGRVVGAADLRPGS